MRNYYLINNQYEININLIIDIDVKTITLCNFYPQLQKIHQS
jgi:hypothetical protein